MNWHSYQIVFRLQAPLHIGWRKSANLQQARFYVPGKNVWGALTFRLTQARGDSDYENTGKKIAEQLRFSYFYPSTTIDKIDLWPWTDKAKAEFDWRYMGSYVSTALKSNAADIGKLHETEYISPRTRDGKQVYLIGYIIEKDGAEVEWWDNLNHLQFGGERGAGWGRVELVREPVKTEIFFEYQFNGGENVPKVVKQPQNEFLLAHALANNLSCQGAIEPFIGRETTSGQGFGGIITPAEICWMPGSKLAEADLVFEIQWKNGIWKRVS
jgi:hypothetical protein